MNDDTRYTVAVLVVESQTAASLSGNTADSHNDAN